MQISKEHVTLAKRCAFTGLRLLDLHDRVSPSNTASAESTTSAPTIRTHRLQTQLQFRRHALLQRRAVPSEFGDGLRYKAHSVLMGLISFGTPISSVFPCDSALTHLFWPLHLCRLCRHSGSALLRTNLAVFIFHCTDRLFFYFFT